ncbi:protein-glutamate O-methyltransferase CheR [Desulfobacterales bacterium HSG2]|nr:protein-glutamate O-methyltransferase CheR [Desulfobacterales bacterium HSG2]
MEDSLNRIFEELHWFSRIDFSSYKCSHSEKRLAERMAILKIEEASEYLKYLRADPSECERLIEALAIKVSSFFRNPIVFEIIAQRVLPQIIKRNKRDGICEIRVWSAGCADGEEAYSIAILICEAALKETARCHPYIFATDISQDALNTAGKGIYQRKSLENTKLDIFDRYFTDRGDAYEVLPFIQKMVRFSRDDLSSKDRIAPAESVFGNFDLVLCRNVLIYFSREHQKRICDKLYKTLNKGGFLILGDSESPDPDTERNLIAIDSRNRIYQKSV